MPARDTFLCKKPPLQFIFLYDIILKKPAPVAQLDRASDYGSEGRGFKSSRARQIEKIKPRIIAGFFAVYVFITLLTAGTKWFDFVLEADMEVLDKGFFKIDTPYWHYIISNLFINGYLNGIVLLPISAGDEQAVFCK